MTNLFLRKIVKQKRRKSRNKNFHVSHLDHLHSLKGIPLASFKSRGIAFILDVSVILVIVVLVGLPGAISDYRQGITESVVLTFNPFHNLKGIITLALYFGSLTYFWRGQTLGKRLLSIRVLSLKSDKLTIWQSIERSLGYGTSALEAGFGFFQAAWSENSQATHDRLAETVVVKILKN